MAWHTLHYYFNFKSCFFKNGLCGVKTNNYLAMEPKFNTIQSQLELELDPVHIKEKSEWDPMYTLLFCYQYRYDSELGRLLVWPAISVLWL